MAEDRFAEGYAVGKDNACYGYGNNGGWGGFGGEWGGIIGLIAVASIFGNGGLFGNNNRGNCATQADVRAAVDQQTLISKLDKQTYGLADSTYAINNTLNSNFRSLVNAICSLGYNVQGGFNTLGHHISDCCCNTQRAIDSVKYEMSKGFCDVIRAGQDNTNAIIGWLTQEKISSLQSENAGLKAQISNDRQSAYLLNELKPCPKPAYITCNPNAPYGLGYGVGFGLGSCCGASVQ